MKFYAVTLTSMYKLFEVKDFPRRYAVAKKVAIGKGKRSGVAPGKELRGGSLVGLGPNTGIVIFDRGNFKKGEFPDFCMINTRYWGGNSTSIAALFFRIKDARKCLNVENRERADTRWKKETKEVLEKIRNQKRPLFIISPADPFLWEEEK